MQRSKSRLIACALVVIAVAVAGVIWIATSRDAWLVKSLIDRMAPWEDSAICYAETPAAYGYFDVYDDATGAYENYVYEIDATDASGNAKRVVLVSFGKMLEGKGHIEMTVSGTSVNSWEYVDADDIPEKAHERLELH